MSLTLDPSLRDLNACGCCTGIEQITPLVIDNRPGLSAIAYRVGTHSQFKQSMLATLSDRDPARPQLQALQALQTRATDDFSIALLDAWATVADILTFYQERMANESYLRTATERFSLLQLAQLLGYKPRPALAASVYLAFKLEEATGAPPQVTLEKGIKLQSVPGPGELPQFYETVEKIAAHAEWNELKPRQTKPQELKADSTLLYFAGIATNLKAGDGLLFNPDTGDQPVFALVTTVTTQAEFNRTEVALQPFDLPAERPQVGFSIRPYRVQPAVASFLGRYVGQSHSADMWMAYAILDVFNVSNALTNLRATEPLPPGVYALRTHTGIFGNNAPRWASLPVSQRIGEIPPGSTTVTDGIYKNRQNSWVDDTSAHSSTLTSLSTYYDSNAKNILLDSTYPVIAKDSWVVLKQDAIWTYFRVDNADEINKSEFAITAKVSRLTLDRQPAGNFKPRTTTVYGQSETLSLADMPIEEPVERDSLELDRLVDGLFAGQTIVVCGELFEQRGVTACEAVTIQEVTHDLGRRRFTRLKLGKGLTNAYVRTTVTINANVALATHGETKQEVLGSGDGRLPFQAFTLQNAPLTYTSSSAGTGVDSTLQVWVDNLRWREVDTLYGHGPRERIYVTETTDEGRTTIRGGDGTQGARFPTGQENVSAVYRQGSGRAGQAKADQISLLMTRPLGVKSVSNPVPTSGGAEAELRDQVRRNAPLGVLTLGRIVSLRDYEDFARAFAGVAKAQAVWAAHGNLRGVFLTVAGDQGDPISEDDQIYISLLGAIEQSSDRFVPVQAKSYRQRTFRLAAGYRHHPDMRASMVKAAVANALRAHFAFDTRDFGQAVHESEIITVMHAVPGVVAVHLYKLYRTHVPAEFNTRQSQLDAESPRPGSQAATMEGAELLILDPLPIVLTPMA